MHSFATGASDGRVMREGLDRFCGVSWRERAALLAISQSQLVASVDEDGKRMRQQEALRHITKHIQLKSPSSVPFPKVTSEIDRDVVEVLDVAGSEEATAARLKELARERAEAERMHDEWMQESRIRMERMRAEVEAGSDRVADEFGDVLFALINYARFVDVNPDEALERTNRRFKARFEEMEGRIEAEGLDLADMPLEDMDRYWDAAKHALGQ